MPKINANNFQLLRFHNEIEEMKTSILYYFNTSKINEFYKHNAIRVNTLIQTITDLQKKYFVCDEDGNPKYEDLKDLPKDSKKKISEPIMLDGMKMEDYTNEFNLIMNRKFEITI